MHNTYTLMYFRHTHEPHFNIAKFEFTGAYISALIYIDHGLSLKPPLIQEVLTCMHNLFSAEIRESLQFSSEIRHFHSRRIPV